VFKRSKLHPNSHWRWWQALGISVFSFGGIGSLLGVLPPFSIAALTIGLGLGLITAIIGFWNWWSCNWWSQLLLGVFTGFLFLSFVLRVWAEIALAEWIWLLIIIGFYLLAWIMPSIQPSISTVLWREQTAPRTRMGRASMRVLLAIAPIAGVLGASFGMYGSRSGELALVLIVIAGLFSIVAIGIAFATSYQLWPDRPWTQSEQGGES
jgi:hypothetical protein